MVNLWKRNILSATWMSPFTSVRGLWKLDILGASTFFWNPNNLNFFFLLKLFQAFGFGRSLNCSVLTHHVRVGQLRTTLLQHREVNCHFWPESEGTNCAWAESWLLESKHSVMDGTTSEYCRRLFTDHLRAPGQLKEEKWIRPW